MSIYKFKYLPWGIHEDLMQITLFKITFQLYYSKRIKSMTIILREGYFICLKNIDEKVAHLTDFRVFGNLRRAL
jgi:hypothetical protein